MLDLFVVEPLLYVLFPGEYLLYVLPLRALREYPGTDLVLLLVLYALFLAMASGLTDLLAVAPDLYAPELRPAEAVLAVPDLETLDLDLEVVLPFPDVRLDLPLPEVRLDLPLSEFEVKGFV